MQVERHAVDITTDGAGAGTGYTPAIIPGGRVLQVQYVPDGGVPFSAAHSVAVTGETTGLAILTKASVSAAFTNLPRLKTQDEAGADALYAGGGTSVRDAPHVANERIKIVVGSGGASKQGRYWVTVG